MRLVVYAKILTEVVKNEYIYYLQIAPVCTHTRPHTRMCVYKNKKKIVVERRKSAGKIKRNGRTNHFYLQMQPMQRGVCVCMRVGVCVCVIAHC